MSNDYCDRDEMYDLYDLRALDGLSRDDNVEDSPDSARQDRILDMQASELESYIGGRYPLPPRDSNGNVPLILTKWVAVTSIMRLYGRRGDLPDSVKTDYEWAMAWRDACMRGDVVIPRVDRANVPNLTSSDSLTGTSQFDHVWPLPGPSRTGTSKGR